MPAEDDFIHPLTDLIEHSVKLRLCAAAVSGGILYLTRSRLGHTHQVAAVKGSVGVRAELEELCIVVRIGIIEIGIEGIVALQCEEAVAVGAGLGVKLVEVVDLADGSVAIGADFNCRTR